MPTIAAPDDLDDGWKRPKETVCQFLWGIIVAVADELRWFFLLFALMGIALLVIIYGFSDSIIYRWLKDNEKEVLDYGSIPGSIFKIVSLPR